MNGATAEPCVNITRSPSSASIITIGPNHHFLRTRMNAHNSRMIPILSKAIRSSIQLEQRPPVDVLAQRRLLLLLQEIMAEHQVIHVGAHEAQIRVVGRADDGLPADVERSV